MVHLMLLWLIIGHKVDGYKCFCFNFFFFLWTGGAGAADLARAVEKACLEQTNFKFLYDLPVTISF